jgi:very-short-patch-repair endonuclease
MRPLSRLTPILAAQHSLVTRHQAAAAGVDRDALRRAVARGELRVLSPTVLALVGSPDTPEQRVLAAVLTCGPRSYATLDTAFDLWGLPGFRPEPVHVVTSRRGRWEVPPLDLVLHTSTFLPRHHTTTLDGIPVVTPTRALFDASGRMAPGRLERTLDNCWSRGLTSGHDLHTMFDELRRRGRPRIARMRTLLQARGPDYVPPESGLEARFHQVCRENGLPQMRRQVETGDYRRWLGRVDFRDPHDPLIVQVNSELHHASLIDRREDEQQTAALERAGFVVVTTWQFDLWHDVPKIVADVNEGYARLRRRPNRRAS